MSGLMTLAILGMTAGAFGGSLTNGVDGMILGGSAGFVLGVLAWITDNITAERESRELLPEHILSDLNAIARLQHNPTLGKIDES
ncbi:MAG TPA: hypothetical protein P5121_07210 [Caldilineaceae bacterium]|nr:hypothetical protein [Caldilineaceae bacterium]